MDFDLSWGATPAPSAVEEKTTGNPNAVQGSPEWLKWRGKGIGSSDAAVLLGWSPWKTLTQLFEEKIGIWKPTFGFYQNRAMERGKELEPLIRKWYEENHRPGFLFPDGIAEDPDAPFRRASYDGICPTFVNPEDGSKGRLIEIKAGNLPDHIAAREHGLVPEKYMPQVQWLMMIANVEWADYVSYGSDDTYAVVSVRADKMLQHELRERSDMFWKHVETKTPVPDWPKYGRPERRLSEPLALNDAPTVQEIVPAPTEAEEPAQIGEQEIEALVAETLAAQDAATQAVAKYEAMKEQLKRLAGDAERVEKGEAVFGWQTRKGTVDYSVIPELIGLDLNQFRKKDVKAFYFKRRNEK